MGGKRVTTEKYMEDVLEIHSGKGYTYKPDWEYTSSKCPIEIHCPEHGWWTCKAYSHRGMKSGCPTCAKITNQARCDEMKRDKVFRDNWKKWDRDKELEEEFLEELESKYGDTLDISGVVYITGGLVKVRCTKHNHTYLRKGKTLLNSRGCRYCASEAHQENTSNKTLSLSEVITKFEEVHGDRYLYHKVKYKNSNTKVEVVCKEHGSFFIRPHNHFRGVGCKTCAMNKLHDSFRRTDEEWIDKFIEEHGDAYDYSETCNIKANEKTSIICPEHGEFSVYPYRHYMGQGCYWCTPLKAFNAHIPATLYYVRITCPDTGKRYYKIGVTNMGTMRRLSRNKHNVTVLRERRYSKGQYGINRESAIIKKYSDDVTSDSMDFWLCEGRSEIFDRDVLGYDNADSEALMEKRCKEYAEYLRKYEENVSNILSGHKHVLSTVKSHFKIH